MSDELVERLRGDWFGYDVSLKAIDAMDEAADRIEGLEENQRFIIRERDRTFSLMLALAEKAEAERDRAEDELYELQQTCITLRGENETLTAERDRLREVVLEADKLLCGDLAGLQWKRDCRSFLVWARAVLRGESHD